MSEIIVQRCRPWEWEEAMDVAERTFMEFVAPGYEPEGIKGFTDLVTDKRVKNLFLDGDYVVFVAKDGDKIVGVISIRSGNHISLLFVDKEYHRMGVASKLVANVSEYLRLRKFDHLTVNASPYGVPFYHSYGFEDTGVEKWERGMLTTPMKLLL